MTKKPKYHTIRHTCTVCHKWTEVRLPVMTRWDHVAWWAQHIPYAIAARYREWRRNPKGCRGGGLHPGLCRCDMDDIHALRNARRQHP